MVSTFELMASFAASVIAIMAPLIAILLVMGILVVFLALAKNRTAVRRQLS
jgi:hypothetical protein